MSIDAASTRGGVVEALDETVAALRSRFGMIPPVGIVLGSGLGAALSSLVDRVEMAMDELPHWPVPGVMGHAGRVVTGRLAGRPVIALLGRTHVYEGIDTARAVFPVRALARAGVKTLLLTNAAGGIDPALSAGTLMVIDDHINFTGQNPLVGPNDERLGPRFPDMSEVYSKRLRAIADQAAAAAEGPPIAHGVYLGVLGPSYETPAEIRAFRVMGASAVGMSTVLEAIAARHMGVEVLGVSCIANAASGLGAEPLSHADVVAVTARMRDGISRLLEGIVARL
jgi:purine-nucleoside phosphorylase